MSYEDQETAVAGWLGTIFSLDSDCVKAGDFHGLIKVLRLSLGSFGILLDYEGVARDGRLGVNWAMRVSIWFQFRGEPEAEAAIRQHVDTLVNNMEGDSTLGGAVVTAVITRGSPIEVIEYSAGELYVGVPFLLSIYERTRGK